MRRFSKSLIALFITLALALSGLAISPASTAELPQVAPSGLTPRLITANPAVFDDGIQNTTLDAVFNTISCLSAGNCVAAGKFHNAPGGDEAFTQNILKTAATPKLTVAATAKVRFRFQISSSVLTKTQKTNIKKMVTKSGKNASFTITGCAGKLPGVTDNQTKALAKKRAQIVQAYLVQLGVKKSHITIKVTITNQGIVPKTKILAKYLNK